MWPWPGHHVSMDGTNVAGWSRRLGEPRLVQPLAIARYFGTQRVRFSCWFDSNFRHCLWKYNPKDAAVFDTIVRMEPAIFKQAPAGVDANGKSIKADPFVLRDAEPDGLVLAGDLYRREARENPTLFGWTQNNPQRRITGQIASNGDILLGPCGEVRIPVVDDAEYYLH